MLPPRADPHVGQAQLTGGLTADGRLLLGTRVLRSLGYGALSIVLVLYLAELGLSGAEIGVLLTLALVGNALISL